MKKTLRIISFLTAFLLILTGCGVEKPPVTTAPITTAPVTTAPPQTQNTEPSTPPTTNPVHTDPPATQPQPETTYILSFAGDCTFGDSYNWGDVSGTFTKVVKDRYSYPLSNVKEYFQNDDYSLVNLECALTESDPTEEEMEELKEHTYRFRGPMEYAQIRVEGGVEVGSCANNHSRDYGKQGLYDTWDALEKAEIDYASFGKSCVTTTESGLTLGIFAVFFNTTKQSVESTVQYLKSKGAEIIIMSIHWGDEGTYFPIPMQEDLGHMAIDAGVDIVFGHHSHTLMPVEAYHSGIIYYSLGNFSFGGNRNPKDKDTAILQQQICRWEDGSVTLGELTVIPCRISSVENWNDFQPTPYNREDPGYERVIAKLEGTFEDYIVEEPEEAEPSKT